MAEIFGISVTGGSSGEGATLTVIAPQNTQSITVKKDEKTYTKQGTTAEFKNLEAGTWEITSLSTTGHVSGKKEVTIVLQYSSQTAYFAANIQVTYPAGSTCTCSKGEIVLNAPDTTGSHIFVVPEAGEWIVSSTDGELTDSESVIISSDGESKSITLEYFTATIVTTFPTDCTSVTCTKGDTVLSVPSGSLASGEHTFSVHEAGEWTVTAENESSSKSETVNVTESKAYSVSIAFTLILFQNGSDNTAVTGGWTSKTGNYVGFDTQSNTYKESYSKNKVDLTGYSTLNFLFSVYFCVAGLRCGASNAKTGSPNQAVSKLDDTNESQSNITATVDVSEINSAQYIGFYSPTIGGQYSYVYRAKCSKIWLE